MTRCEGAGASISAEVARSVRASTVGLNCTGAAVVSTVEALCDSEMAPGLREQRSHELFGHLGELHRALAALDEGVRPPAVSGDLVVVEGGPLVRVPDNRWRGWRPLRRPQWGSALGGLEPPRDPDAATVRGE